MTWSPEDLAALHVRCFSAPPPWSAAAFAGLLQRADGFLCAGPQGFALGRVVLDEAELLTLAVEPAARRAGHGRALLADFEAEAVARGAVTAFLEVAAGNAAACALYTRAGYGQTGLRRGYYGAGGDALVMCRRLGGVDGG